MFSAGIPPEVIRWLGFICAICSSVSSGISEKSIPLSGTARASQVAINCSKSVIINCKNAKLYYFMCQDTYQFDTGLQHYKKLETFYNQHTPALRVRINPSHESLIQCFYFLYGQTGCFCDIVNR